MFWPSTLIHAYCQNSNDQKKLERYFRTDSSKKQKLNQIKLNNYTFHGSNWITSNLKAIMHAES
jgi:hypothetical protein